MLQANYHSHDRSDDYVARDYAYNLLNNCEQDALLFTNGDNDTFPLWYLQEVEGIRKDVRVICLSLLNTGWYISQLKHREPRVPISWSDAQIEQLRLMLWEEPKELQVPVTPDAQRRYIPEMEGLIQFREKPFSLRFEVKPTLQNRALRVQDQMVLHIVSANRWRRPVYFAVTVAPESFVGLEKYLRLDGMVYKLVPAENIDRVYPSIVEPFLHEKFRFTGINDPSGYLSFETQMLLQNYRNAFLHTAYSHYNNADTAGVIKTLDAMERVLPESLIPIPDERIIEQIGGLYYNVGRPAELEKRLDHLLENTAPSVDKMYDYAIRYYQFLGKIEKAHRAADRMLTQEPGNPKAIGLKIALYEEQKNYDAAIKILQTWLQKNPGNRQAQAKLAELEQKKNNPQQ